MGLDALDGKILDLVQENNQLTHAEIGETVGLSTSAVRKRLVALRQSGVIERDVAILRADPTRLQLVVTITLASTTRKAHDQMEALILATPEITTAYHTRYRELIMVHIADHGELPMEIPPIKLGKLSPA